MKTILVVANETLGGRELLAEIQDRARHDDELHVVLCVPRKQPRHGNVIYDDAVLQAAQVRIDLARSFMHEEGIDVVGEVGDPDPYAATMDAVGEFRPDEIIISTFPAASSGWLRRDLIERITASVDVPVTHVVADIDREGLPFDVTLVVANRTATSKGLLAAMKDKASHGQRHLFIVVVPQEGGDGRHSAHARERLDALLQRMEDEHLLGAGMIGDPDPYTATMNAQQFFRVDDILISTLAETRSGWLRADLVERVRKAANKPVEHIVAEAEPTAA